MSIIKKHGCDIARMPGTKPSLHSGQTIISSGIPSLDHILDGGIPLGSLVIIEEDRFGDYAKLMLSYFMSEAVCNGHSLLVASRDTHPSRLTRELPAPADPVVTPGAPSSAGSDQKMTIAWRYQGLPQATTPTSGRFGQHYDLSRFIEQATIDAAGIATWAGPPPAQADSCRAADPLTSMLLWCDKVTRRPKPALHRLAIASLGSPLWGATPAEVGRACHLLRALARVTSGVAMVTVPTHLWSDGASVSRIRRASDICLGLESFQGTRTASDPAFSEYHGLLRVHRLSTCNVLAARYPRSADLAFKVRRKKFVVETLHLPPEPSETVSRTQEEGEVPRRPAAAACQSARPGDVLDF